MATEQQQPLVVSMPAGADLSGLQYQFVKIDTNEQAIEPTANTDNVVGVLQNTPSASGQVARVCVLGATKVVAESAFATPGTYITTSSSGTAILWAAGTDTTKYRLGRTWQVAAARGDVIMCMVNCIDTVKGLANL